MIFINAFSQDLARSPHPKTNTRWISPENPSGGKGKGGLPIKEPRVMLFSLFLPDKNRFFLMLRGQE